MRAADVWAAHQRKRFMRPDASRYVHPEPYGVTEIKNAVIDDKHCDVALINSFVAELKFYLALKCFDRKYRPDQSRDDHGRWVDDPDGGNDTSAQDDVTGIATDFSSVRLPRIPDNRPPGSPDRTIIAKEVAEWLKENADVVISTVVPVTSWLYRSLPNIVSYFDAPKTLEELQQDALEPANGYNIHHVVEQSSARADGYPMSKIDAPENLVRVPTMKRWDINGWYQTSDDDFGGASPRDYLRQKDWDERERVGLHALRQFGILKP